MRAILLMILLMGCGTALEQQHAENQKRDPCYEKAEAETQERIDNECPNGALSQCPAQARDDIAADLKRKHEACRL